MKHNVPVQSLIDHIKTATDVDPWAKEMAEELLKEQEHKDKMFHALEEDWKRLKALLKEQETERLDFIGAVAKLTAENEMLKKVGEVEHGNMEGM